MESKKYILMIVAFQKLYQMACRIVEAHKFPVRVEFEVPNYAYPPNIQQTWMQEGVEVTISRGGTRPMLERICPKIPAVEIQVDALDILGSLQKLVEAQEKIGFIGHENIIFGIDTFQKLFPYKQFVRIGVEDWETALRQVRIAGDQGVMEFISDSDGALIVEQAGYTAHIVQSGESAVISAIQEAERVAAMGRQARAKAEEFRLLMNFIHDGIVALDSGGQITLFNKEAQRICRELSMGQEELLALIDLHAYHQQNSSVTDNIIQAGPHHAIAVNASSVVINNQNFGAVATFQNINQIQRTEREIRTKMADKGLVARYTFSNILYKSPVMEEAIAKAKKYARSEATVLICGKTGCGKELFAQSIHNYGPRADGPFVAINCAALPEQLLESELFGYREGAFTGARKGGKMGLFELAHMGTILLDEIAEMPLNLQAKLLRIIQERVVMRVGDEKVMPVDVRVIVTTNESLRDKVERGEFRQDLYYRLNILYLEIPALEQRREDIPLLAEAFLKSYARDNGKHLTGFSPEATGRLQQHCYEGNIRELRGIVERSAVLCEEETVQIWDLGLSQTEEGEATPTSLRQNERQLILKALQDSGGNQSLAARRLGINRSTLYRKCKQLNL